MGGISKMEMYIEIQTSRSTYELNVSRGTISKISEAMGRLCIFPTILIIYIY